MNHKFENFKTQGEKHKHGNNTCTAMVQPTLTLLHTQTCTDKDNKLAKIVI